MTYNEILRSLLGPEDGSFGPELRVPYWVDEDRKFVILGEAE